MANAISARAYLLVDGHSVIHAWPELRKLHTQGARRHLAREQLMQRLRGYQDQTGCRVVVVFDGTQARTSEIREPDGLQVIYADAGATADTVIERLAAKYAGQVAIRVASADGMVRETIHAHGADWISPEGLKLECERSESMLEKSLASLRRKRPGQG
jgi:predicted RNA-binding protein with PIN domain